MSELNDITRKMAADMLGVPSEPVPPSPDSEEEKELPTKQESATPIAAEGDNDSSATDATETTQRTTEDEENEKGGEGDNSEEEIASNRANKRIRELVEKNKKLEEELKSKSSAATDDDVDITEDEENKAIEERMKKLGYIKKDELEQEQQKKSIIAQETRKLQDEINSLRERWGEKLDRSALLQYMKDSNVLDVKAAFWATHYDKVAPKDAPEGYSGLAGKASGNTISTGDKIRVGAGQERSVHDEAMRIAATAFSK